MIARVEKKLLTKSFATIAFKKFGKAADVLESLPAGAAASPLSGHVSVKIGANQVSTEDFRAIRGLSMLRKTAGVAGTTGVGSISSVGDGVSRLSKSDKVLVVAAGVWTDNVSVPASSVIRIPDTLSLEEGAALPAALSAYAILHNFVTLKAGDVVVQNGGDSAVGKAISQIGAAAGFTVVSATSAEMDEKDFSKKISALGSVKLAVSNSAKKNTSKALMRCLGAGGSIVMHMGDGATGDDADGVDVPVGGVIFKSNSIYGFDLGVWVNSDPSGAQQAMASVAGDIEAKKLILKSKVFPQSEYLKALSEVETSGGTSVVLKL